MSTSAYVGDADASQSAASADVNISASSSASNTTTDVCVSVLSWKMNNPDGSSYSDGFIRKIV